MKALECDKVGVKETSPFKRSIPTFSTKPSLVVDQASKLVVVT